MLSLGRINMTPMKGTELHHPSSIALTDVGIAGSRRFFLITEDGALCSGSCHGPLVQVHASVAGDVLSCRFPDGRTVSSPTDDLGGRWEVDFEGKMVAAREVRGPLGEAFSDFVGRPVTVVRTESDGAGVDVLPLTIVCTESVAELGRLGGYPGDLDARRFRINLEVDGGTPFEEDTWDGREVALGDAILRIRGQIPRCVVTTQDPDTGLRDWNTLKQIASFRPLMADRQGVPFGMYAEVVRPAEVRIGAVVSLLDS
jgi:uncharacterized protein YcbX